MPTTNSDVGFYVGSTPVLLIDIAKAIAVHEANGELMKDPAKVAVLVQDAKDILDRAFRYARDRKHSII